MKYKRHFVMSKFVNREHLLESKVKYLEAEVDNTLQRLHMAKRRAREDKVKLRNIIATYQSTHVEIAKAFTTINGKHRHGVCPKCLMNGDVTPMEFREIFAGYSVLPVHIQRYCPRGH